MKKLSLRQQLVHADEIIQSYKAQNATLIHQIKELELKVSYHRTTERRFDQLLEAMAMGMKEANLPRRSA